MIDAAPSCNTRRLPAEMEQRLNVLAKTTKRPKSFYVREALERSLKDIEDAYMAEEAYVVDPIGHRREVYK